MAQISESTASLRISGDDLDPAVITMLLGCEPTQAQKQGQQIVGRKSGHVHRARTGMWRLEATRCTPEDLNTQIREILSRVSSDLTVWHDLASKYRMEIFVGLFLNESNEGMFIDTEAVKALGDRGIEISLDIYGPTNEQSV